MTEVLSVYVTASSREEAEKIAAAVVEDRLAACANIFPVQSIYRWQGKVDRVEKCALILKTTAEKFGALEVRIKELHSYDCPCIVAWPVVAGSAEYLEWVAASL